MSWVPRPTEEAIEEDLILLALELDRSDWVRSEAVEFARRANLSLVVLFAQKFFIWITPRSLKSYNRKLTGREG
jgi:hypothetical protein